MLLDLRYVTNAKSPPLYRMKLTLSSALFRSAIYTMVHCFFEENHALLFCTFKVMMNIQNKCLTTVIPKLVTHFLRSKGFKILQDV